MDRKGQLTIGTFILLFVGIIVALALLTGGISSSVGTITQTTFQNYSQTCPNSSATPNYIVLRGQAARNVVVLDNDDGTTVFDGTNWTVSNYVVRDGTLESRLTAVGSAYNNFNCRFQYTSEPFGYDTSGGGRVMTDLILIFAALAIAVFTLVPVIKNGFFDFG